MIIIMVIFKMIIIIIILDNLLMIKDDDVYIAKMRMAIVFETGLKIYLRLYLGKLVLKTSRDHCLYLV